MTTPRWLMVAMIAGTSLLILAQWQLMRMRDARMRARQAEHVPANAVTWRGKTIRVGDVVKIAKWAGTFKSSETGYPQAVDAAPNQTGTVLGGELRTDTFHLRIDPAEPVQIVRVKWPRQRWKVSGRDQWIVLDEFEATIHVEHLQVEPAVR